MSADWPHWSRLAPISRSTDLEEGLAGRVHDPLWLLSRQWQLAELRGADAGTPVDVAVRTERDALTAVELRGDGEAGAADAVAYDGGPLEPLIEREPVMTGERVPTGRLAAEAGSQFRRLLASTGVGEYPVADFPEEFHLETPEEPMEAADRRYFRVMDGRALDGAAIYAALADAVEDLATVVEVDDPVDAWNGVTTSALPLPAGASPTDEYRDAALAYAEWYLTLYDEPDAETGTAWRPTRLEYDAAIRTGAGETAASFDVSAYPGGRLDRDAFVPGADALAEGADDGSDEPPVELDPYEAGGPDGSPATTTDECHGLPTMVNFPGMPDRRWWEFTDASLALSELSADGVGLAKLLLLEYAVEFGADWFTIPVEAPIGSFVRITECTVTDVFGVELPAEPVTDDWWLYRSETEAHDEPGLLLPPTLADVTRGDPIEEVVMGRDELANLVFALERVVEGPADEPVDRTEFQVPTLEVETVHMAEDPDREYVTFTNPGEDSYDLRNHEVRAVFVETEGEPGDGAPTVHETIEPIFSFDAVEPEPPELGPGESITLYTGTAPSEDDFGAGLALSVWHEADAVDVYDTDPDAPGVAGGSGGASTTEALAVRKLLTRPDADGGYRLSTAVPPYWFPFTMDYDPDDPPTWTDPDAAYRLTQALLLDADSLDAPLTEIPRPEGLILAPDPATLPAEDETGDDGDELDDDATWVGTDRPYWIYEEEVTRSGVTITRTYQLARWTDGTTHLWSGRRTTNGAGELASGLRFDVLEELE
ncbi:hypothetical protein [Natronobeatus ordinarius]|uniref:hypothetical protein n=1 Tax=Natronobeatus ordinarius TaxID=2963433 RepID=UPI0020CFB8D2|nr:hypothetical protein [Natronobeatus ordinarius]